VLVSDITPGDASYDGPSYLTAVGSTLYFAATDDAHGRELWKSDGTAAGTVLVKDTEPGPGYYGEPTNLTISGGDLFFTAIDELGVTKLWRSDGTTAGTVVLTSAADAAGAQRSGPAPRGCVADCYPDISDLTDVAGTLYFSLQSDTTGIELWASDGTPAGTGLVQDLRPGAAHSHPSWLADRGGTLFFSADDGVHGRSLFKLVPGAPPTCNGLAPTITGSGTINGTAGPDVILASGGADVINGRGGNDTICAGGGDDTILQGTAAEGADLVNGQAGVDTVGYSSRTPPVTVTLTTNASGNDGATGEGDNLVGVENATGGSGADVLTGSAGPNLLSGGAGNDTLNGSAGVDTELGGNGDDKFVQGTVANGADLLNGQGGTDLVSYASRTATVTVTLAPAATGNDGATGEADNLSGVEDVTGGAGNDTLTGAGTGNVLSGGAGNDALRLRDNIGGNDTGNGGTGTDTATYDVGDAIISVP
jgi:ELWxxDGT repeat protein